MKCITSPALDGTQILSFVEGEADDAVVAHINECPYCSERARQWTRWQNRLQKQLYRSICLTPMELGDYHLGMLPPPQALIVAQHVRECAFCRREMAQLEEYLAELDLPRGPLEPVRAFIGRLIGGQTGGLSAASAYPALRGEAKGPLVFEADDIVITLDVQSSPNGQVSIQGQLAADDQDQWTGAVVRMLQIGMPELTASLDDLGAFGFEEVRPGSIQLKITSPTGVEVQILNIDIAV